MRLRRGRFADLVQRQLELFEADEAALLGDARRAEESYNSADRNDSEERFGDWQHVVDEIAELLFDVREAYAATLDDSAGAEYRRAFDRAAESRLPAFTGLLQ